MPTLRILALNEFANPWENWDIFESLIFFSRNALLIHHVKNSMTFHAKTYAVHKDYFWAKEISFEGNKDGVLGVTIGTLFLVAFHFDKERR